MQFLAPTLKKARWEDGILAGSVAGLAAAATVEWTFMSALKPDWLAGTAFEHGRAWGYGLAHAAGARSEVWSQYSGWMQQIAQSGHPYFIPFAQSLTVAAGIAAACWGGWEAGKPRTRIIKSEANSVLEGSDVFKKSVKTGLDILYFKPSFLNQLFSRSFKINEDRARSHWLVAGGTGSGKSVFLFNMLPAIYKRRDRAMIVDYKGIFERWMGVLNEDTLLLDPSDKRSSVWGIARDIQTKQDARDFAASMIAETKDPSWSNGARAILTAILIKLQKTHGNDWGWADLKDECNQKRFTLYNLMLEFLPESAALLADERPGSSYLALFVGATSTISDLADGWGNRKGLSIKKWMQSPQTKFRTIFLKISKFAELSKSVNTAILNIASSITPDLPDVAAGERPLWVICDEFPRVGKVLGFDTWISAGRSKDIRIVLCVQSKSQLQEIYGDNTSNSWIDSIGTKVLGRQDADGAKWASSLIGDGRYERPITTQNSAKGSGSSHGWQSFTQPIFSALRFQNDLGKVRNDKFMRVLVHGYKNSELLMDFPISAVADMKQKRKPIIYADFCLPPNLPQSAEFSAEKVIAEAQAQAQAQSTESQKDPEFIDIEQTEFEDVEVQTQSEFMPFFPAIQDQIGSELKSEAESELTDHLAKHLTQHLANAVLGAGAGEMLEAFSQFDQLASAINPATTGEAQITTTQTQTSEQKKKLIIRRKKSQFTENESENSL